MSGNAPSRTFVRSLVQQLNHAAGDFVGREVLAPVTPGGRVRTQINGFVITLRPREEVIGWHRFRVLSLKACAWVAEAEPYERQQYLEVLPSVCLLLLWPDPSAPQVWWAVPYNPQEAAERYPQQFASAGTVPVHLTDPYDGPEPCARVLGRVDGGTVWYGGLDYRADPRRGQALRDAAESAVGHGGNASIGERNAMTMLRVRAEEVRAAEEAVLMKRRKETVEDRLRAALKKADAVLESFTVEPGRHGRPDALVVNWRPLTENRHGTLRTYRSRLTDNLEVLSSGICLSGRDRDFDMTSLVDVVQKR